MSAGNPALARGGLAGAPALPRGLAPALLALLLLGGALLIAAHPRAAVWDQKALLEARFESPHWPSPARGFTSQLLVASLRAVTPFGDAHWNEQVRVFALALYAGAAVLLASALLRRRWLVALFALFLFSSQYPFLWLSSELFTGALLCLALWSWGTARPRSLTGALLALFALCKPDLIFAAVVLLAWWAWRSESRPEALALAGGFAGALALLLLPGTLVSGFAYFHTYSDRPGGRSLAAFMQHWAALISHLQVLGPPPNPWTRPEVYFDPLFPGARSMSDVVFGRFPLYAEFVALSCVRGLFRAVYVFHYAIPALPLLWWAARRRGRPLSACEKSLVLSFVGVLPFVLFAFPHVRYLARYYPLFLLLVLAAGERVAALPGDDPLRGPCLRMAGIFLGAALAENARRAAENLARIDELSQYWFPD